MNWDLREAYKKVPIYELELRDSYSIQYISLTAIQIKFPNVLSLQNICTALEITL